jgi:hypothetical protein
MRDLKFFEEYYVGFKKTGLDNELLGFATQTDGTKAFEKRKGTVDSWRDKEIDPITLKNVPRLGFKIVDSVSRYQTSNKLFRVEDPMGFQLEISAENLFSVISECAIIKGMITDKMVWAREKGNHYLTSENSEEYKESLKENVKFTLTAGMMLINKVGNILYRYEGAFYVNCIDFKITNLKTGTEQRGYYSSYYDRPDYSVAVSIKRDPKPFHVYSSWHFANGELNQNYKHTEMRRSVLSDLQPTTEFGVLTNEKFETNVWLSYGNDNNISHSITAIRSAVMLFNTKEEAKTHVYTDEADVLRLARRSYYVQEKQIVKETIDLT